jgi:hypothetical protein
MRWAGNIARMVGKRKAYRMLVGTPGRKRPLGSQDVSNSIKLCMLLSNEKLIHEDVWGSGSSFS